jgi:hypothetical protein
VQGQITSNVFAGLTAGLGAAGDASKALADDQSKLADLQSQLASAGGSQQADLQKQIDDTTADIEAQQGILKTTALSSQQAASASAGAILAGIAELQKQGVDFVTALTDATPAINALQAQLDQTGLDGGAAFAQIKSYADLAADSIAGPALKAAAGFGQALVGLNNSGLLTQDVFEGLSDQIAQTRDNLVAQGKDGSAVLKLLAPQLQQIWEIQQQTGMAVDDTTQSLLDEAQAQGLVGEKFEGPQQQMIDALGKTNDILTAIGKALGADLPADAASGAAKIQKSLDGITAPDLHGTVTYDTSGGGGGGGGSFDLGGGAGGDNGGPAYARNGARIVAGGAQYFSTSGIVMPRPRARGSDNVSVVAQPGELLLNAAHQGNLLGALQTAIDAAARPAAAPPQAFELTDTIMIGGEKLDTVTRKFVLPSAKRMIDQNVDGIRTSLRQSLGVKG